MPAPVFLPNGILVVMCTLAGFLGGMFLYHIYMSQLYKRMKDLQNILYRGQIIGIVDDVSEDRIELVPLVPLRKGIYVSTFTNYPLIVFVPSTATPRWSLIFGKPILYVIAFKLYGAAFDPRLLTPFGIAKIGLQLPSFDCSDNIFNCVDRLVEELYKYLGEKTITLKISPDIRLGIAYNIPKIIRALLATVGQIGTTTFQQIQETSQLALELTRYMQRMAGVSLAQKQTFYRFLLAALIIGGSLILIFLILMGTMPLHLPPI